MNIAFFNELINTIADQGRRLLNADTPRLGHDKISSHVTALLSEQGEARGVAIAQQALDTFQQLDDDQCNTFFQLLIEQYGYDHGALQQAIHNYQQTPNEKTALILRHAAQPKRLELFKRLNRAPGGTKTLLTMRAHALSLTKQQPHFAAIADDLHQLFSDWFNRGFLVLQRIDWNTPAAILEKIIKYEAVHEITSWDDLRRRIQLPDRQCYGFFHPALNDEPLIFVEVALTQGIPNAIAPILAEERTCVPKHAANTAVFYSISNCQKGLQGISFGNFLIKQVVQELKREHDNIKQFVTLSPVPAFTKWLDAQAIDDDMIKDKGLTHFAVDYFTQAKHPSGKPYDPVARFHLGNGAILQQINEDADISNHGIKQSRGLMVNYLYNIDSIEANHERYMNGDEVVVSKEIERLVR